MPRNPQHHRLGVPAMVLLFSGCAQSPFSSDPCEQLCRDITSHIRRCSSSWGMDWQDLGAKKQDAFLSHCVQEWKVDRATMEPRELDQAHSECQDGQTEQQNLGCDELRALYLP